MRRLRGGEALGVLGLTPRVLAALGAGWVVAVVGFLLAALTGVTRGLNVGALVSALGTWLVFVLFALALQELWETLTGSEEPEPEPDQRGFRRPWAPAAAILGGGLLGFLLWH